MTSRPKRSISHNGNESITIGAHQLTVLCVSAAYAKKRLARILRKVCHQGAVFLLHNGKNADGPIALMISGEHLERLLSEKLTSKTLGEVLASLPTPAPDVIMPRADTPDDVLPTLRVPT